MKIVVLLVLAAAGLAACGADALRRAPCMGRGVRINPVERPQNAVPPARVVDAPDRSPR